MGTITYLGGTSEEVIAKVGKGLISPEAAKAQLEGFSPADVQTAVLAGVAEGVITPAVARVLLPAPKAKAHNGLTLKVSPKRALSVYGLGRFPITLYAEQWERLLAEGDKIRQFITTHKGELAYKS